MVLKRGAILGYDIAAVRTMDGMTPIILDFMLLGRMILALLTCLMTKINVNCQGRLLASKLALEPPKKAERALKPNAIWLFLPRAHSKAFLKRHLMDTCFSACKDGYHPWEYEGV